jgi:hypothetical protein
LFPFALLEIAVAFSNLAQIRPDRLLASCLQIGITSAACTSSAARWIDHAPAPAQRGGDGLWNQPKGARTTNATDNKSTETQMA